ncbi:hypothetical protein BDW66DRAFT_155927 [Aspergillus desertorum]
MLSREAIYGLTPGLNYEQKVFEGHQPTVTPTAKSESSDPPTMPSACNVPATLFICPLFRASLLGSTQEGTSGERSSRPHRQSASVDFAVAKNSEFVAPPASEAAMYIRLLAFGSGGWMPVAAGPQHKFFVHALPFHEHHVTLPR